MNTTSPDYSILISGLFNPDHIRYTLKDNKRKYGKEIEIHADLAWKKIITDNPFCFDGTAYSLINYHQINNELAIILQETSYKYYLTTNCMNFPDKQKDIWANILAMCCVVETNDEKIIFGRRSYAVSEDIYLWHIPAGNLDSLSGEKTFHKMMLKEISEELNISEENIETLVCTGLGLNLTKNKPELLFYAKADLSEQRARELFRTAVNKDEHTEIIFVDKYNVETFINFNDCAAIAKAAINQYLQIIFRKTDERMAFCF